MKPLTDAEIAERTAFFACFPSLNNNDIAKAARTGWPEDLTARVAAEAELEKLRALSEQQSADIEGLEIRIDSLKAGDGDVNDVECERLEKEVARLTEECGDLAFAQIQNAAIARQVEHLTFIVENTIQRLQKRRSLLALEIAMDLRNDLTAIMT